MSKYDFINFKAIKDYIIQEIGLRSSDDAVNLLIKKLNREIKTIIKESVQFAEKDRRKTIMERHMKKSILDNLRKTNLDPDEILEQILKQKPTELGKISQGIKKALNRK